MEDLKTHILSRLTESSDSEFTSSERNRLMFRNDRIYQHHTLRINYTRYDMRRDSWDTINPRTRSDIMLLAGEEEESSHPYWYARVIGIFHATVALIGGEWQDIDFLWV